MPEGDFRIWLILAGRGFGKTRSGAEWIRERVKSGKAKHIALIGRTAADVRDVMVNGPSGLLSCCPPDERPVYEPSRRRIVWPNGAVAQTFSSQKPDQLRGPQMDTAWCDELAAWEYPYDTWDQLMFGLRLGDPKCVVTTTPRPIQLLRDLIKSERVAITRGTTFDNRDNLADSFYEHIMDKYDQTNLGKQELYAQLLDEVPGALWTRDIIDNNRVQKVPDLARIVIAVDPAMSANKNSDETGIVVVGLGEDGDFYVLEDLSARLSVDAWARVVVDAYHRLGADRVVAEVNQGGDLVEKVIRQVDSGISYRPIRASKGKFARAEPVSARYEQGRVKHTKVFSLLEDQLCTYSSSYMSQSPDRLDALVYGITELDSRSLVNMRVDNNSNYVPKDFF
tara:strand:- start:4976 stop:6160 length:1185 start_codon:yes stop_codon:yes gene_type:complete